MEIMMEMTDCRRLRLKTKQERTLYSSLLGYNVFHKISFLLSLTDLADSQFAAYSSSFAVFAVFVLIRLTRPSILQRQLSYA